MAGPGGSTPVARLWSLSGGRLGEPDVARDFCAAVLPRLGMPDSDLGRLILVDRKRSLLRGISITDDPEVWGRPREIVGEVGDLLEPLAAVSLERPHTYEVVYARFRGVHGRPPTLAEIAPMRARIGMLQGGDVLDPDIRAAAKKHMAGFVAEAPGCVAALLLSDPERQAVVGATVWADAGAAARTIEASASTFAAVAAASGSTLVDRGSFEVLDYDAPTTRMVG